MAFLAGSEDLRNLPLDLQTVDSAKIDYTTSDAVVMVAAGIDPENINGLFAKYLPILESYKNVDKDYGSDAFILPLEGAEYPIKRLIFSTLAPINDYFDVREYSEAAYKGVKRAIKTGANKPIVILPSKLNNYPYAEMVSMLGAMQACYRPLELRTHSLDFPFKTKGLTFCNSKARSPNHLLTVAQGIENGRAVARDIGGSDPERMSAPNVANYVNELFRDTCIRVNIISDPKEINTGFPLLAAVNRATKDVARHTARIVFLEYVPEGPIDTTLVLVGKGVTYDTGGADVKAGGHMAGMHRDKCGAAAVAGFFKSLEVLRPKGIKVVGAMSMVRNSIGSNSYVADEIITARSGERVRVGNTDAEGRMAMADVLCYLKDLTEKDTNRHFFTIATLTGHACLAVGQGYSIIIDNGPARKAGISAKVQKGGDLVGDPFEVSTLRREDVEFHKGKSEYETILQCNNLPSSQTPRGHQSPAAFLLLASGLSKNHLNSDLPIKFSHIDIAGSSGPFPGIPTGAPIAALTATFLFDRLPELA